MNKYIFLLLLLFAGVFPISGQNQKYTSYTVKKGETLRSIAKKNNIRPKELFDLNPDVDRRPEENTVILIPVEILEVPVSNTFSYTVLPKETIYGISKKFEISIEKLFELNPSLVDGLKDGQTILIPKLAKQPFSEENQVKKEENVVKENSYKVQKGETLYSISKKFQITVDNLIKLNPILVDGLKDGQIILISKNVSSSEIKNNTTPNTITYIVEKGDTVYNLTKRFQITEEQLFAQNPTLVDGVKIGMELHINSATKLDSIPNIIPKKNLNKNANLSFKAGKSVNVVMMLPFKLNEIEDVAAPFSNSSSLLNIVTEFYQGALVAVDSLRSQGAIINLKSFDTENNSDKIVSILKTNQLYNTDVFIGPFFLSNANLLARNITNGLVIAPMNSKDNAKFNDDNLVKTGVSNSMLEDKIIQYIKKSYNGQKVIVIGDNKPGTNLEADRIARKLKLNSEINFVSVLKPENGYITKERFLAVLNASKQNWIILVGDDNIVITDAVNTYGIQDKSIDIKLFTLKNEGIIEKANNVYLARLQYTFPSSDYSNFDDINVQNFVQDYKSKYFAPPSNYAIRGFDVTYDSLFRILLNGKDKESLRNYSFDRIGSRFDYKNGAIGSLENDGIFILKYEPDLSLTLLE